MVKKIFRCESCDGEGGWHEDYDLEGIYSTPWQECPVCGGSGDYGFWNWAWSRAPEWLADWLGG
jgi:DnaJ-class molecular chaperone